MRYKEKCPGVDGKGCPDKQPAGPRGGRCRECGKAQRRATGIQWYREVKAGKRVDPKAQTPAAVRDDVAAARAATAEGVGFNGATKVWKALMRAESFL